MGLWMSGCPGPYLHELHTLTSALIRAQRTVELSSLTGSGSEVGVKAGLFLSWPDSGPVTAGPEEWTWTHSRNVSEVSRPDGCVFDLTGWTLVSLQLYKSKIFPVLTVYPRPPTLTRHIHRYPFKYPLY